MLKAKKVGDTGNIQAFLLEDLLADRAAEKYYTYYGSFMTPPCSEIVKFLVSHKINHVNEVQVSRGRGRSRRVAKLLQESILIAFDFI